VEILSGESFLSINDRRSETKVGLGNRIRDPDTPTVNDEWWMLVLIKTSTYVNAITIPP